MGRKDARVFIKRPDEYSLLLLPLRTVPGCFPSLAANLRRTALPVPGRPLLALTLPCLQATLLACAGEDGQSLSDPRVAPTSWHLDLRTSLSPAEERPPRHRK